MDVVEWGWRQAWMCERGRRGEKEDRGGKERCGWCQGGILVTGKGPEERVYRTMRGDMTVWGMVLFCVVRRALGSTHYAFTGVSRSRVGNRFAYLAGSWGGYQESLGGATLYSRVTIRTVHQSRGGGHQKSLGGPRSRVGNRFAYLAGSWGDHQETLGGGHAP